MERIFLSPSEEEDIILKIQENRLGQVDYPFAVVVRNDIKDTASGRRHFVESANIKDVILSRNTSAGEAEVVRGAPVNLDFEFKVFDETIDLLDDFYEAWVLHTDRTFEQKNFTSSVGADLPVSLTLKAPEDTITNLDERRETGLRLVRTYPFEIQSVIVSPVETKQIILEPEAYTSTDTSNLDC